MKTKAKNKCLAYLNKKILRVKFIEIKNIIEEIKRFWIHSIKSRLMGKQCSRCGKYFSNLNTVDNGYCFIDVCESCESIILRKSII